jgi:hypothetical protein
MLGNIVRLSAIAEMRQREQSAEVGLKNINQLKAVLIHMNVLHGMFLKIRANEKYWTADMYYYMLPNCVPGKILSRVQQMCFYSSEFRYEPQLEKEVSIN